MSKRLWCRKCCQNTMWDSGSNPQTLYDRIAELEAELREAHHWGYMAGVGDSEDYDHDPSVMEKEAWADYLAEKDEGTVHHPDCGGTDCDERCGDE